MKEKREWAILYCYEVFMLIYQPVEDKDSRLIIPILSEKRWVYQEWTPSKIENQDLGEDQG